MPLSTHHVARILSVEDCPPFELVHSADDYPVFYDPLYYPDSESLDIWLNGTPDPFTLPIAFFISIASTPVNPGSSKPKRKHGGETKGKGVSGKKPRTRSTTSNASSSTTKTENDSDEEDKMAVED
ncbi:hypothetical protein D9611_013971 [Ephemerocybe angulata]|uniref:Uncharacterized protein n=1 Tax=Ephemerocybe angulata TaxID=980116 RepID=A0A8H5AS64_9AGAR|nr:hypothetical protein D9611_013971 [Tulosesus angulatus]